MSIFIIAALKFFFFPKEDFIIDDTDLAMTFFILLRKRETESMCWFIFSSTYNDGEWAG